MLRLDWRVTARLTHFFTLAAAYITGALTVAVEPSGQYRGAPLGASTVAVSRKERNNDRSGGHGHRPDDSGVERGQICRRGGSGGLALSGSAAADRHGDHRFWHLGPGNGGLGHGRVPGQSRSGPGQCLRLQYHQYRADPGHHRPDQPAVGALADPAQGTAHPARHNRLGSWRTAPFPDWRPSHSSLCSRR